MATQRDFADQIRRLILVQSKHAGVGHIASALSIADIVAVLFDGILRGAGTDDPDRDRFVLSKGHASLALYCALHLRGLLPADLLNTYCGDGTLLGVHPDHHLRGVDFSTGSLGLGLSLGAGSALGARLRGSDAKTFVLISDAELNEGSTWEAVLFAAHHRLGSLTAIVDANGQQALGRTAEVLDLGDLAEKWRAFGWDVRDVDGHAPEAPRAALGGDRDPRGRPRVVIARTVAGKGVSFMEGKIEWHYLPLSDDLFATALREIGAAP